MVINIGDIFNDPTLKIAMSYIIGILIALVIALWYDFECRDG